MGITKELCTSTRAFWSVIVLFFLIVSGLSLILTPIIGVIIYLISFLLQRYFIHFVQYGRIGKKQIRVLDVIFCSTIIGLGLASAYLLKFLAGKLLGLDRLISDNNIQLSLLAYIIFSSFLVGLFCTMDARIRDRIN